MIFVIIQDVTVKKQITFTPRQFQLEEAGFKKTMKKLFNGTEKNVVNSYENWIENS